MACFGVFQKKSPASFALTGLLEISHSAEFASIRRRAAASDQWPLQKAWR
jgi:hypothetical protein